MSNAILHNLESGSNELQSGFSENQLKLIEKDDTQPYLAKWRIQNLVEYNTLPESFACLFDPQRTFGNPLRAVFSKIEIFSGTAKFSSLYAGGPRVPPRVLAVWAKTLQGQKRDPCLKVSVGFRGFFFHSWEIGKCSHQTVQCITLIIVETLLFWTLSDSKRWGTRYAVQCPDGHPFLCEFWHF